MTTQTHLILLLTTSLLVACSDSSADLESGARTGGDAFEGGVDDAATAPDFIEAPEESRFLTPRAGRDYVFVPNETLDTVSKIDADSLEITSIPVGDRPTRLQAVEDLNLAVVLNQDADTVSVIRADARITDAGVEDEVVQVAIDPRQNELAMTPDGRYAMAWFSFARQEPDEPSGNPQTVSLVDLTPGAEQAYSLTVGFEVRGLHHVTDADGQVTDIYIITETGLSLLDLDQLEGDAVLPVLQLTPRPLDQPSDREVAITSGGRWAVTRDRSQAELYIVSIPGGELRTVPLPGLATDVDLFPGQERALLVIEEAAQLLALDVPTAFADDIAPESHLAEIASGDAAKSFASISPSGRTILSFTPRAGSDILTSVTLDDEGLAEVVSARSLHKGICQISMSPDDAHALILHPRAVNLTEHDQERCQLELAEDLSEAERFAAEHPGYSIYDLETGFSRLVLTEVYPEDVAWWWSEQGSYAYISFLDEARGVQSVDRVDLQALAVEPLALGSPPSHLGRLLGRRRVWVNQEHPLGRMTFIDVFTGEAKTVTGFELNRFVR